MIILAIIVVLGSLITLAIAVNHATAYIHTHPSNFTSFLRKKKTEQKRVVLLVTAHPDDECMFFTPAIIAFRRAGWQVSLLCATTGDADGLGGLRQAELAESCNLLSISPLHILNDTKNYPDSMTAPWNISTLSNDILSHLESNPDIQAVLTFDSDGISGHPNHRSVCQAVRIALGSLEDPIDLYELETVLLPIKYSSILSRIHAAVNLAIEDIIPPPEPLLVASIPYSDAIRYSLGAMRLHASQLVWFRWIYLLFSRYTLVNSLRLKKPQPVE